MKALLNLDLVGKKPDISIRKRSHYKTFLGSFFTLTIISLTILNSKDTIEAYINKTYPSISEEYLESKSFINFTMKSNPLMFTYGYLDIISSNITYIKPREENDTSSDLDGPVLSFLNVSGGSYTADYQNYKKYAIKCDSNKLREISTSQIENEKDGNTLTFWNNILKQAETSYCLPEGDEPDYTNIDENGNGRIQVITVDNDNLTRLNNKYGKNSSLRLFFLFVFYSKVYFTPGSSEGFYTKRLEYEVFPLQTDRKLMYIMEFQNIQTTRDYSEFFLVNKKENEFISVDKTKAYASVEVNDILESLFPPLTIQFTKVPIMKLYTFKYSTISDIISSLGGSFDIIFFSIQLIHNFNTHFNYKAFILNSVFMYHTTNQEPRNTNLEINNIVKQSTKVSVNDNQSRYKLNSEDLNSELTRILSNRVKYTIKATDIVKSYYNTMTRKNTVKDDLITKSEELISKQIDFTEIIKSSLDLSMMKTAFYEKDISDYFTFPSINLHSKNKFLKEEKIF